MASTVSTATEYIKHHMVHLEYNLLTGELGNGGFWTLHLDTIFFSVVLGILFVCFFAYIAQSATVRTPSNIQCSIEAIYEFVNQQIVDCLNVEDTSIGALSLTIFVWVFLMNFMDLIPVDLFPVIASHMGIPYLRAVPTADLNMTFALSGAVFLLIYAYAIKFNGFFGWIKEVICEPFGILFFPVNIIKHLIADFARPVSLSLRLFGNIYAGEIVFILIALTPATMQWLFAGAWLGFHLFVITIQAFIFMMLTIVYISLTKHEH
ncbi:MAG: F0F1 ATP synthase subunit A [Pseudomonadota bacterium]|nr:F0F1 ATP synthase subunit A [Pseudomonadota bacterium]